MKNDSPLDAIKSYRVGKEIGSGSFGKVYEGRCKVTQKQVAIKLIILNECRLPSESAYIKRLRQLLSEVLTMHHLTTSENNGYTVKLLDVVLPDCKLDEPLSWAAIVMSYMQTDLRM